jgi:hypothetical protein
VTTNTTNSGVQGEGDCAAGRKFQEAQHAFATKGPVDEKAHEAAEALDGPEAVALEAARQASAKGESVSGAGRRGAHPDDVPDDSDPHTERNLDKGLEETFPASDPVSISPGAD